MSLMRPIKQGLARVLGGDGDYSVTVPVMDGPLKPNDVIEATGRVDRLLPDDNDGDRRDDRVKNREN